MPIGALTYNFTGVTTPPATFTYNQVDADMAEILQPPHLLCYLSSSTKARMGAFNVVQQHPDRSSEHRAKVK